jgi:HK97 family phage prohead protease/HK97 family phage major capsid protein
MARDVLPRAYSTLLVKAFDEEQRLIEGVASTPTPDRVGDILEPSGAVFAREIPLLLYHDSRRPVGVAQLSKTGNAITFSASIPAITEPGILQERVAEAWQSLKAQLIRGVSIGFRILDDGIEVLKTGGWRITAFEILELSLVAVPANVDATITAIKSIVARQSAASGTDDGPRPQLAGDAALRGVTRSMKTTQEQITGFEATRQAKSARMLEIMNAAGEKGETLDAAAQQEYDELAAAVKSIDEHLVRLRNMEELQKAAAVPARGASPADAQASRQSSVIQVKAPSLPPGIAFTRMVLCKAASFLSLQRGEIKSALDFARERYPSDERIQLALKAAVPPATTTDPAWAGVLVDPTNLTGEFVEFLRPMTIIGKFGQGGIPPLHQVPFNIRTIGETADGDAWWVGQGKPKPLTKFGYQAMTLGWAKLATITVITQETARRMDIDFVIPSKAAVANVSPASITNGLTPLESSGDDAAAVRQDIAALINAYVASNQDVSSLVLIMPNTLALAGSLMRNDLGNKEFPDLSLSGGTVEGIPVIPSQYVANIPTHGNIVIAVNADEVYFADDGQATVDVSTEASLEMSDAPTQDGVTGLGAELVSLWQNNLMGLRAERFVNWQKRRPEAVVYMHNVTWGAPAGSP